MIKRMLEAGFVAAMVITASVNMFHTEEALGQSEPNMLLNPGFEDGDVGQVPPFWKKFGGTFVKSADQAYGGSGYSGRYIDNNTSASYAYQVITQVNELAYYDVAGCIYDDTPTAEGYLRVDWYGTQDGSGGSIGNEEIGPHSTDSGWQCMSGAVKSPEGAQSAKFKCYIKASVNGGGPIYFDDLYMAPAGESTPINFGEVVINEIAWMGTAASGSDEWIELYNTTEQDIVLTGSALYEQGGAQKIIDISGTIGAQSYFLIERGDDDTTVSNITGDTVGTFDGGGLSNDGEHLLLMDAAGNIVDEVNCSGPEGWFKGVSSPLFMSMERRDPLLPGNDKDNWCTHDGYTKNGYDAGDPPKFINGTPKAPNSCPEPPECLPPECPEDVPYVNWNVYFNEPDNPGLGDDLEWELKERIDNASKSIDIAIYRLSVDEIVEKLIAAKDKGVVVRIVTELNPDSEELNEAYLNYMQPLVDEGIQVVPDPDLNKFSHNKFAIFDYNPNGVNDEWVWTGSYNFTGDANINQRNNVIAIESEGLAEIYQTEFDCMLAGHFHTEKTACGEWFGSEVCIGPESSIAVRFSPWPPGGPYSSAGQEMINAVKCAQEEIYFSINVFNDFTGLPGEIHPLADAILERWDYGDGVMVKGIFGYYEAHAQGAESWQANLDTEYDYFWYKGMNVGWLGEENPGGDIGCSNKQNMAALHHKYMIIDPFGDQPVVVTGSMNWTENGNHVNDENTLIIRDAAIAQAYFDVWCADYAASTIYDPNDDLCEEEPIPLDPCSYIGPDQKKGDINGDGVEDVNDVQKAILIVQGELKGEHDWSLYTVEEVCRADLNCSGTVNVTDVQLAISFALGIPLDPLLDQNGNGIVDTCESDPVSPLADYSLPPVRGSTRNRER